LLQIDPADYQAKVDQASAASMLRKAGGAAKAVVVRTEANVGEAEAALRAAETEAQRLASDYPVTRPWERMRLRAAGGDSKHAADAAMTSATPPVKKVVATQQN